MLTPTHSLLALAALAKKDAPQRNLAVLTGSLLPDAFIYGIWIVYMILGKSQSEIWDVLYFQNPTQVLDALFNSVPIYALVALGGYAALRSQKRKRAGELALVFGLAALIHIASDLPVHASDAHRHFWPLSDWRFYSPLSYWEAQHHSAAVSLFEAILGILLCVFLWRRFHHRWSHVVLGFLIALNTLIFTATLLFMTGIFGGSA